MSDQITESFPEKPKRGRPRHPRYAFGESVGEGHFRTDRHVRNAIHWGAFIGGVMDAGPEYEIVILGGTGANRPKLAPRGLKAAATEAHRYAESLGTDEALRSVVQQVADAKREGVPWGDITSHYRQLRLGARSGNPDSLMLLLARTLDDYQRRFPGTTREMQRQAVTMLLGAIPE